MAKQTKSNTTKSETTDVKETKMSAPNFSSVLDQKVEDIEKPKPLPVGTYIGVINAAPEIGPVGKNNTLAAKFKIKILMADSDVDQDLLSAMGGIKEREIQHTLWLTEDAAWRAKEFVEQCGVSGASKTLRESLTECMGCQIKLNLNHRPSEDGKELYLNIKSTASAQ